MCNRYPQENHSKKSTLEQQHSNNNTRTQARSNDATSCTCCESKCDDSDDDVKKNSMLKKIEDCMSDGRKLKHKSKVGGSIKMRLRNSNTMKECKVCGVR